MPTQDLRQAAESFGIDAARYDRTRPPYPAELLDRILAATPGRAVLNAGCGTGIEARQLRERGCTVLGVEPDRRMADVARASGIPVEVARLEEWQPAGRSFDLVVAGTAWHWIDPVAGAAKAAQVLRPGGRLAPFWHTFRLPDELTAASAEVFARLAPDSPIRLPRQAPATPVEGYRPILTAAADGIRAAGGFTEPEQWQVDWEKAYTRDEWLDQLPTSGAFTRLPGDQLAAVCDAVGAAIDRLGGGFVMAYTSVAVTAVRTSPAR
ncbi:methyltransferase type 11 [Actinoplanes sp. SE50]|uniref:class I SAM-dependent methyltransferase n=1 Tax=unclassified Actinoplanes TaxID=2626549 RepID=UPI00023ECC83|nr:MULTISPECIES: class I SAM-dependent methyltransferase [unclassified Actinoplanes]AEV83767.1 tRNA (mo5U34)-methyltransferase [Actinoplanes sp. SE50/110]ATO82089.1 methyltransferase type 11 [Actinoplanes sp. SE50]SLL99496.1 methyltransferase type 11 [Actinoplanes sp. SE50/110]